MEAEATPAVTEDGRDFLGVRSRKDGTAELIELERRGAVPTSNGHEIDAAVAVGGVCERNDRGRGTVGRSAAPGRAPVAVPLAPRPFVVPKITVQCQQAWASVTEVIGQVRQMFAGC